MAKYHPTGKPAGRPESSMNKMSRAAREEAARSGRLPHEILLDIARGNPQKLKVVMPDGRIEEQMVGITLEQLQDAAKAAAPYYAPKISTVELITGVSDDDLDEFIARAAAEAGVGLSVVGEGPEGEEETGGARKRNSLV